MAAEADALVGTWKLISWQGIYPGEAPQDIFGAKPKGYLIVTPEKRLMVVITGDGRKPGMGDAERAALHKTLAAYTGKIRVEGSDFITSVDVSWNEAWSGTDQKRTFKIEGDKLFIDSVPAPSMLFPGKIGFGRLAWEREK